MPRARTAFLAAALIALAMHPVTSTAADTAPRRSIEQPEGPPPACPGDLNGDGSTNSVDLNILLADFGCIPLFSICEGDADGDGDTDSTDLNLLLANFGCEP